MVWKRVSTFKESRGVTLIELLIALVISSILIATIYYTFIRHQKTYIFQEEVVNMQQNVRVGIAHMVREIRMAGFGGMNENRDGTNDILATFKNVNGFTNIIFPEDDPPSADKVGHSDRITIIGAFQRSGRLDANANTGDTQITIAYDDPRENRHFNTTIRRYLCLGGRENHWVTHVAGSVLTIVPPVRTNHTVRDGTGKLLKPEVPVFLVRAVQYGLRMTAGNIPVLFRDLYPGTTSSQRDTVAENIDDLQFQYILAGGGPPRDAPVADPKQIQTVRVTIRGRTPLSAPEFVRAGMGAFRERTITSNIQIRNR